MPGIVIDCTRHVARALHGKKPTGVDRAGLAYIAHFGARAQALVRVGKRWVILSHRDSQYLFEALLDSQRFVAWKIVFWIAKAYVSGGKNRHAGMLFFNVVHSGLDEPNYAEEITRRKLQPIFFLHDIIPITFPEYSRPGEAESHKRRLETMLSTARGIIVNSRQTQRELEDYAGERRIPPVLCPPLAGAQLPPPAEDRPMPEPYFVTLGTIEARKNHLLLLNLWRELAQELGAAAPKLIVIGRRGWECEQAEDMLDRCEQLKGLVLEKSHCDDMELSTWLAHARALLFPTFAEGFGLPLVEALALGTPVIASDLSIFREIAGDIPEYINPLDAVSWKRMILEYAAETSAFRAAQKERMRGFQPVTWDKHFVPVEQFIRDLGVGA